MIAAIARVTMEIILSSTDTADAALIAMELQFGHIVIKELALLAVVPPKHRPTVHTRLIHRLSNMTDSAHHLLYSLSIQ